MTGYYDYVLALIPTALLGITALLTVAGVSLTVAVPVASSASGLLIGHALFVNSPVDTPDVPAAPAAGAARAD